MSDLPCLPEELHSRVSPRSAGAEKTANFQALGKLYLGLNLSPSRVLNGHKAQRSLVAEVLVLILLTKVIQIYFRSSK